MRLGHRRAGVHVHVLDLGELLDQVVRHRVLQRRARARAGAPSRAYRAKYTAAWPAEFAPPTMNTFWSAHSAASVIAEP